MNDFLLATVAGIVAAIVVAIMVAPIGYFLGLRRERDLLEEARLRHAETISIRDEFHMTEILAQQLAHENFVPDLIACVAPGGNMIGEWLSRRFLGDKTEAVPLFSIWMTTSRDDEGRSYGTPAALSVVSPQQPDSFRRVLVINDISRSGYTLEAARKFVEGEFRSSDVRTAVLLWRRGAAGAQPDFWVDEPTQDVAFEWKGA